MVQRWPTTDEVRRALGSARSSDVPALPGRTNHLRAGVLVPVVWDPDPVVVLTRRTLHLSQHAGEICFPGGRPEERDQDLEATALREAREELGIESATVLGRLTSVPLYTSNYRLEPFVAEIQPGPLSPNPNEVASVERFRLGHLLQRPTFEAIPYELHGRRHLSPLFFSGSVPVFGATAHVFWELLQVLAPLFRQALPALEASDLHWGDVFALARGA